MDKIDKVLNKVVNNDIDNVEDLLEVQKIDEEDEKEIVEND